LVDTPSSSKLTQWATLWVLDTNPKERDGSMERVHSRLFKDQTNEAKIAK